MELDEASALVTGGSSGIGAAVVARLQAAGARVAVLDLQEPGSVGPQGVVPYHVRCDIADEVQVDEAVRVAHGHLGGIDLAVLNAGVGGYGPLVELSTSEWDRVLGVNLRGTFLCLRAVARTMIEGGRGGALVVIGSISGQLTERHMGHYTVSKAGVAALARVAARELGPFGIRVNTVAPGATDTPLFAQTAALPGYQQRVAERAALGGVGNADAVAQAVVSVLQLDWVTGQVVAADGGVSLWSPIDPIEGLTT